MSLLNFLKIEKISSPEDLHSWMSSNLDYGYIGKSGKRYDQEIVPEEFYKNYRLQAPIKLVSSKLGVCWDQVELQRACFELMVESGDLSMRHTHYYLEQHNEYQASHSFSVLSSSNDNLYWFENSYGRYRGIHGPYTKLNSVFDEIIAHVRAEEDAADDGVSIYQLPVMKYGIDCMGYMRIAKRSKHIYRVR